ncbi:helix-turn-helix domain-containing protein [Cohnella kolymensis]|uniref:helix-turn-helix domain-containing protein n=1 Tax=Cohnella kolymensis TaxID=1590652 RepID=UPI0006978FDA|nr:helix-turn-helix transcriptional regulator [Cohnella kolymensis]
MRNKTLGERLKHARENARLTQIQVAKKLEVSNGAISGYERNYRDPDTETLKRLADLYGVSNNWLLTGEETKESVAYTLPEGVYETLIKEAESLHGVNLHDDPVVLQAVRNIIDSIAQTKKQSQ